LEEASRFSVKIKQYAGLLSVRTFIFDLVNYNIIPFRPLLIPLQSVQYNTITIGPL